MIFGNFKFKIRAAGAAAVLISFVAAFTILTIYDKPIPAILIGISLVTALPLVAVIGNGDS